MNDVILGAGFTGLAAGYKTGLPIYEAGSTPGGICKTYEKDGFVFQNGGPHWIFGDDDTVEDLKKLVPLKSYDRNAGVYYNHTFPYPIQTMAEEPVKAKPGKLKWWLGEKFSKELCNMFLFPFNEKYTAGLYDEIVQFDVYKTPKAGSPGFVCKFHDPIGGLNSLLDVFVDKCDIKYNRKAWDIDTKEKVILFDKGDPVYYENLYSTIPLDQMIRMTDGGHQDLPYTSVLVLNIGAVPGNRLPKEHWVYVPYCKSGFYRIGIYSNVDASKAPKGMVSISVEMAFQPVEYGDIDVEKITKEVIAELQEWNFIKDVITIDPTWVKHAYTWMHSEDEREKHIKKLAEKNIYSIGRYGKWKFQGLVESIKDGFDI